MKNNRKQIIEALKTRAMESREKIVKNGKSKGSKLNRSVVGHKSMKDNPLMSQFVEKMKSRGVASKATPFRKLTNENVMKIFKNRLKKGE